MHLLAPVKAQNHVAHLAVCKVDNVVVDQNAVRGEREAEILVVLLLDASRVLGQPLYNVKIHQRFAAEEIDLEIMPRARVFDEEIERPFSDLEAHQRAFAAIFALRGEAVGAIQVAGMRHVQAKRLHYARRSRLEFARHRLEIVGREELARRFELRNIVITFLNFVFGYAEARGELLSQLLPRFFLEPADQLIRKFVHRVNASRAGVDDHIHSAEFISMYHLLNHYLKRP